MHVIAIGTPFTADYLLDAGYIDNKWVVTDPANLQATLAKKIDEMR
ncbi:MAG: hypothetical protein ACI9EW_001026 [Cellvibrionaceae bacterium]|jgi:hypothetical protein